MTESRSRYTKLASTPPSAAAAAARPRRRPLYYLVAASVTAALSLLLLSYTTWFFPTHPLTTFKPVADEVEKLPHTETTAKMQGKRHVGYFVSCSLLLNEWGVRLGRLADKQVNW
jgi:hypothetical protein